MLVGGDGYCSSPVLVRVGVDCWKNKYLSDAQVQLIAKYLEVGDLPLKYLWVEFGSDIQWCLARR